MKSILSMEEDKLGGFFGLDGKWSKMARKQPKTRAASKKANLSKGNIIYTLKIALPRYIKMASRLLMMKNSFEGKIGQVELSVKASSLLPWYGTRKTTGSCPPLCGSGTMAGAAKKLAAFPKLLKTKAMPVAVVLS